VHSLVGSPLRTHDDAADLLHLGVVRGAHSVQVACNLRTEIRDDDKLLEHILRQNVGVASFLNIVTANLDVVGTKVEVGG